MIPASYLFKDIYNSHWEEPEAPTVVERNRPFLDGLTSPLTAAIAALRHPPARTHARYSGGHAYE